MSKTLRDMILPPLLQRRLATTIAHGSLPNMLICGPSGSGKSCLISCLIGELKLHSNNVLLLRAANNRGLDFISSSMQTFCKRKSMGDQRKLVVLDDADNITTKAQSMIANLMEDSRASTSFVFTCYQLHLMQEGIQSRCVLVQLGHVPYEATVGHLRGVCIERGFKYEDHGLCTVAQAAQGDMRRALGHLELTANNTGSVTEQNANIFVSPPRAPVVIKLVQACSRGDLSQALACVRESRKQGFTTPDVLQMLASLLRATGVYCSPELQMGFLRIVGESSIVELDNDALQLMGCAANMVAFSRSLPRRPQEIASRS